MRYYYSLNNQPLGPVPIEQLHELYRSGTITLDTLIAAEGASEWKPYRTLSAAPAAGSAPSSGAAAAAASTPPSPTPSYSAAPSPAAPAGYKNLMLISWGLIIATALVAVIPLLGCASWFMFIPVFIACVVMGIMILNRGGTRDGILILIASVVVLPVFTLVAPIITTAIFGKLTGTGETPGKPAASPTATATPAAPARTTPAPTPRIASTPAADEEDEQEEEEPGGMRLAIGEDANKPAAATPAAGDLPNTAAARQMVNNTMLNFKNAVNSGDFEPFYRTQLSELWKKEIKPEGLRKIFNAFVERKVDLTPIFAVQPVIEPAPYIDGSGFLVLEGRYPVEKEKVNVTFKLSYAREAKWGLAGINVQIKPLEKK